MEKDLKSSRKISSSSEDEFKVVSYKKRKRRRRLKKSKCISSIVLKKRSVPVKMCTNVVQTLQEELKCSDFIMHFKEDLLIVLNEWNLGHLIISEESNGASLNCVDDFTSTRDVIEDLKSSRKISSSSEDEFIVDSHKKRKRRRLRKSKFNSSIGLREVSDPVKICSIVIQTFQEKLESSDFIMHFKEDLFIVLNEWNLGHLITSEESNRASLNCVDDFTSTSDVIEGIDILCYGLGKFSECIMAGFQLGFLLVLKQILHSSQVHIFDPAFSTEEVQFLKELGFNVLDINEKAKNTLKTKCICFMPHCDLALYNNLLWANWNINCLSKLVIIGNSFQNYELNHTERFMKQMAKYVCFANKFATEIKMSNIFYLKDIFNDLSIHYFKTSSLSSVDSLLWTELEEPKYDIYTEKLMDGVAMDHETIFQLISR